jgi:predicted GNAT family acetyltransferase
MKIQQKDDGETGMFFIKENDETVAEMVYSWQGKDRIIIEHTEVGDALKGKGTGKELVAKSVEFARERSIKIIPVCSFAKRIFDKTKEFQDVL